MVDEKIPNGVIKAIDYLELKRGDNPWDAGFRATQLWDVEEWLELDNDRYPRDILLLKLILERVK